MRRGNLHKLCECVRGPLKKRVRANASIGASAPSKKCVRKCVQGRGSPKNMPLEDQSRLSCKRHVLVL